MRTLVRKKLLPARDRFISAVNLPLIAQNLSLNHFLQAPTTTKIGQVDSEGSLEALID